jgi:hypothetical protein
VAREALVVAPDSPLGKVAQTAAEAAQRERQGWQETVAPPEAWEPLVPEERRVRRPRVPAALAESAELALAPGGAAELALGELAPAPGESAATVALAPGESAATLAPRVARDRQVQAAAAVAVPGRRNVGPAAWRSIPTSPTAELVATRA